MSKISYVVGDERLLDDIGAMWIQLSRHHQEVSLDFKDHFANADYAVRKAGLLKKARSGRLRIAVAVDEDGPKNIGYCASSIDDENCGEVDSLYVNSGYRGQRIGERLLTDALKWLGEQGAVKIRIEVATGNDRALKFYRKFGFCSRKIVLERSWVKAMEGKMDIKLDCEIMQHVSGTAFVVNYSRSRLTEISLDSYAGLWVTDEAVELWHELCREVYPNDDLNLSLRTRFYLSWLESLAGSCSQPAMVVLAAGFTNYPFLLPDCYLALEYDFPHIVDYKQRKTSELMAENLLPLRTVEYLSADLNSADCRIRLRDELVDKLQGRPTVVIMEGITYYLTQETLTDILTILSDVLPAGSIVALDYWPPDCMDYPVMQRLKEYLDRKFGCSGSEWLLLADEYFQEREGFQAAQITDIAALERKYTTSSKFQGRDGKIPVRFVALKKRKQR